MQQILFLLLPRMPGIWGEMREMGTLKPLKLIITEAPGSRDGLFSCINYKGLEIKGGGSVRQEKGISGYCVPLS